MRTRTLLFSIIFLGFGSVSKAQCPNNPWLPPLFSDSLDFEHVSNHVRYHIDTSMVNNVWRIGAVSKAGFPQPLSPVNALQTDTLIPYPVLNESAVMFWPDSAFNSGFHLASVSFWHHYDVDSLTDSLLVQLSIDSGKTWLNPTDFVDSAVALGYNGFMISYDGIRYDNLHPYTTEKIVFTGSDTLWTKVSICFTYMVLKPARQLDSSYFGIRFLLKSDTVQLNKPGWIIDDLKLYPPGVVGGLDDVGKKSLSLYPMPSASGEFHLANLPPYEKGEVRIYDMTGQCLNTVKLATTISIAEMADGIYFYKVFSEGSIQYTGGKLMKY